MPGITGIVGPRAAPDTVQAMVDVMRHEAFYRTGVLCHERSAVAAGWAVLEGTPTQRNPVWNDAGNICLILAGEEFTGTRPGDHRDLVRRYEAQGASFVDRLNGTCSGVVVDLRDDTVILFNDRFGLARIYVHEGDESVYFSSEAKSILCAVEATRELDQTGLAEYASCGCALQGRTLFKGVSLLAPSSRWTFKRGRLLRKERYFNQADWEQLPALSARAYYDQLRDVFPAVVRKYFKGDARVAMSLTGGLDGRMIMACSGHRPGELPCYTFGGPYRDCADVSLARRVAELCGQPHQVISVDERFVRQFGPLAEKSVFVSDGAMDVTGSVELYANAQARMIAPVRMTGNYGSEILRSNVAFKAEGLDSRLFSSEFVATANQAAATYRAEAQGRRLSLIAMKQVPWHHPSRLAVEQSQLTMRSPYLDNDLVRLAYQAPTGQELSKIPALQFVADKARDLARIATDRGVLLRPTPVLTGMQNLFQEFMFKAEYAYDYGMPHWLASVDRLFKPARPERLFLGRHKFYHFRVWYRDQLASYLTDVLLDPRSLSRAHLAKNGLRSILKEHLSGTHNHTTALHQALSIELIHRQLIDRRW